MKKILLFLLLLPFLSSAQTTFVGANGAIIRSATTANFVNSVLTRQVIFTSTVKGGAMTIDRPYAFTCDLGITTAALSLPTVTFDVTVGSKTLTFVTAAVLVASLTNAAITISGYVVLRADGTIGVKFNTSPTGATTSPIGLLATNTNSLATWTGLDTTVDQTFSIGITYGGIATSNVTCTRYYYARSEF